MSYRPIRTMYNTQQQQQPQFQQPSYNGYAQGPPPNQYAPPSMTYAQAQDAHAGGGPPPFQQQQLVQRPQGENASYYDLNSNLNQNPQSMQPYMPAQGQSGAYLNPQDQYRRRSSQASHHSHHSHNSRHSHKSGRSGSSRRSREAIPDRASLGDTLLLMWETLKGAFEKRHA